MKLLIPLILLMAWSNTSNAQSASTIQELLMLGEFSSAEELSGKAKSNDPEMAFGFIRSLVMQGKISDANKAVIELMQIHPKNVWLQIAKGEVLLHEGKTAEAKTLFKECLNNEATDKAAIRIAIGSAYAQVGMKYCDPDFAISILHEANSLQPSNGIGYIYIGDCNRCKLVAGMAVEAYSQAMKVDKKLEALANYKIASVYVTQKNCEAASTNLNNSLTADPSFLPAIKAHYQLATSFESGCYDKEKAKFYYNEYVKKATGSFETECFIATHHYTMQEYSVALQSIKEIQKKWPARYDKTFYLIAGQCYAAQNDFSNVILSLEQYLIEEKNAEEISIGVFMLLAKAYSETGNSAKVKASYIKAASLQNDLPKKIECLDKAAAEDVKEKKHTDAAAVYEQIISLKKVPSAADYFKCGTNWYQGGEIQKSKKIFQTYAEKFPSDWRAPYYIANNEALLDTTLSVGSAVPFYEKAIALGATDPSAKKALIQSHWYLFGYAYQVKKNTTNALKHLDAILAIEPTHPEAIKYKKLLSP